MKSFRFRLERVLAWRATQLTLAQAKSEQLAGGLRTTNQAMTVLIERRAASQAIVGRTAVVSGADLITLETNRVWTLGQERRLAAQIIELRREIVTQDRCVAEAHRGVKLVERLKERKHETWKAEADRELDELAAESAISQWRRLN